MLSHKHLCLLDGKPELGDEAFSPSGKTLRLYKGGGGGSSYYGNLDKLYEAQTEQAKLLGDVAKNTVAPGYQSLVEEARLSGGVGEQNFAAQRASEDAQMAAAGQRGQTVRAMTSMGVDPSDPRFMRGLRSNDVSNAAMVAGAGNQERNRVRDQGFARRQDAVSMGLGLPGQASAAFGNAGSGYQSLINSQLQQQQAANSAIGNAVAGGISGYGLYKNFNAANGGLMTKDGVRSYADGGVVKRDGEPRFARGGFTGGAGFSSPVAAPAAPPMGASFSQPTAGEQAVIGASAGMQGAAAGKAVGNMAGDAMYGVGKLSGSQGLMDAGRNFSAGVNNSGAIAKSMVDQAMYGTPSMTQAAVNAGGLDTAIGGAMGSAEGAAAVSSAAGKAAAAEAGTVAATGANAGMLGAAMPWVGGALMLDAATGGKLGLNQAVSDVWDATLGNLFADGGEVDSQRVNGLHGGEVDGPGGPTDDLIPAWLSDGEFVMTAEAVQHFGLDKLNKMNQVGLAIRNGTHGKSQSKEKAA